MLNWLFNNIYGLIRIAHGDGMLTRLIHSERQLYHAPADAVDSHDLLGDHSVVTLGFHSGDFGRQEQLAADPYLETREKEDAFLQRIESTICNALRFAPMAAAQSSAPIQTEPTPADDDLSMALDFADSF